jgi:hypothetical protein
VDRERHCLHLPRLVEMALLDRGQLDGGGERLQESHWA